MEANNQVLRNGKEFDRLSFVFQSLTGQEVESFFFPGLKNRYKSGNGSAVTTTRSGEKLILTYRNNLKSAELEAEVLRILSQSLAPVPKLISQKGRWLVQEFLGENRLTQALNIRSSKWRTVLMERAICSLVRLQNVAREAGLHQIGKPIGISSEWRKKRISALNSLGHLVNLPTPSIDENALNDALIVNPDTFIKWDARAGNAILRKGGSISWFDWEHSGCRSSIDDLIWFLADEWIPGNQPFDLDLLKKYINLFKSPNAAVSAQRYFFIHGTLHMCGRLVEILSHKGSKNWWKRDYCLEFDQMGITELEAVNLTNKAAEWSRFDDLTSPISSWLLEIKEHLKSLN